MNGVDPAIRRSRVDRSTLVLGASGHAKVVIEVLRACGVEPFACIDATPTVPEVLGVPVRDGQAFLDGLDDPLAWECFVAIGDNDRRARVSESCEQAGLALRSALSPASHLSPTSRTGPGTLVMPQACLNADAVIGRGVIVNTAAVIEHDCVVGDFAHVAPNATLGGWVEVGRMAMVGLGAQVMPQVRIGDGAVVGAGSVVIRDVPAGAVVVGNPARRVR